MCDIIMTSTSRNDRNIKDNSYTITSLIIDNSNTNHSFMECVEEV